MSIEIDLEKYLEMTLQRNLTVWFLDPDSEITVTKTQFSLKLIKEMEMPLSLIVRKENPNMDRRIIPVLNIDAMSFGREENGNFVFETRRLNLTFGKVEGKQYLILETPQRPIGFFRPEDIVSIQLTK